MAVESEGCSQGVVHGRSRAQVGCGEEAQQEDTDSSLACPVQGCSLGAACKVKDCECNVPALGAAASHTLLPIDATKGLFFSNLTTTFPSEQNQEVSELLEEKIHLFYSA